MASCRRFVALESEVAFGLPNYYRTPIHRFVVDLVSIQD